jgi:hypothetical protein
MKTQQIEKVTAIDTLIEHCQEMYPHFESERGQADIANAKAEHAALNACYEVLKRVETIPHFDKLSVEATRGVGVYNGRNKLADEIRSAIASINALRSPKP